MQQCTNQNTYSICLVLVPQTSRSSDSRSSCSSVPTRIHTPSVWYQSHKPVSHLTVSHHSAVYQPEHILHLPSISQNKPVGHHTVVYQPEQSHLSGTNQPDQSVIRQSVITQQCTKQNTPICLVPINQTSRSSHSSVPSRTHTPSVWYR